MTYRVSLESLSDGKIAVVKTAPAGKSSDLRSEAEWLAKARHRGIVELLGISDEPSSIRTLRAGSVTLQTGDPSPQLAAVLLADVAVTLADMHAQQLVHGSISLDHIIINAERTRICSPSGTATDPVEDLNGLGEVVRQLLKRWKRDGIAVPFIDDWTRAAARLESDGTEYSARRSARELAQLSAKLAKASPSKSSTNTKSSADAVPAGVDERSRTPISSSSGLILAATLCVVAFAGLYAMQADAAPASALDVIVGEDRYSLSVDEKSDGRLLALETTCAGDRGVVYLDADQDELWLFESPESSPQLLATVPGAVTLTAEPNCQSVSLRGPAGAAVVRIR